MAKTRPEPIAPMDPTRRPLSDQGENPEPAADAEDAGRKDWNERFKHTTWKPEDGAAPGVYFEKD